MQWTTEEALEKLHTQNLNNSDWKVSGIIKTATNPRKQSTLIHNFYLEAKSHPRFNEKVENEKKFLTKFEGFIENLKNSTVASDSFEGNVKSLGIFFSDNLEAVFKSSTKLPNLCNVEKIFIYFPLFLSIEDEFHVLDINEHYNRLIKLSINKFERVDLSHTKVPASSEELGYYTDKEKHIQNHSNAMYHGQASKEENRENEKDEYFRRVAEELDEFFKTKTRIVIATDEKNQKFVDRYFRDRYEFKNFNQNSTDKNDYELWKIMQDFLNSEDLNKKFSKAEVETLEDHDLITSIEESRVETLILNTNSLETLIKNGKETQKLTESVKNKGGNVKFDKLENDTEKAVILRF